ncbi:hypothetical protein ANCDUO_07027 [Ancylostoma duodenale]|uniref:Uncharacterized protein n=1 Tax=Ancylostoma duodenale TaxID=51022 RepID=A0A0C2DJK8_9BILA|nr:hypothetical protein ANCDUO_07027 [Ancylostoma duodenale]
MGAAPSVQISLDQSSATDIPEIQKLPDLAVMPPPPPPPDYKETKKAPPPVTPAKQANAVPLPATGKPPSQQKATAPPPSVPAKSPLQQTKTAPPPASPATPPTPTKKVSTPAAPLTRSQLKPEKKAENKSVVKTALIVRPPKDTKTLADPWAKNYDTLLPLPPSSAVFTKRAKVTMPSEPLISK